MSSASRRRDNSTPIWRAAFKNAAHRSGFSRDSSSRRGRLEEAMERLKQRSGPAPPEDGPFPGCPARLPRAMKETGRSAASRPREPTAAPRRGEGSAGRPPSPTPPSTLQRRRGPATGPVKTRQARDERLGCPPPPQRTPVAVPTARCRGTGAETAQRYVTRRPSCHPAPSLARWA